MLDLLFIVVLLAALTSLVFLVKACQKL